MTKYYSFYLVGFGRRLAIVCWGKTMESIEDEVKRVRIKWLNPQIRHCHFRIYSVRQLSFVEL